MKKSILLTLVALMGTTTLLATEVNLDKLSKPVRKFVEKSPDMEWYTASCDALENCHTYIFDEEVYTNKSYYRHIKEYSLDTTKSDLFNTLINDHPSKIWNGDSKFQLLYRKTTDEVFYNDSKDLRVQVGDIVMLELTPKVGILKARIPVAFQIITLDEQKGQLTFSYLSNNKSKGVQQLNVQPDLFGNAYVVHTSRYLSASKFRDKHVYEPFHEQFTDDFYVQIVKHIKKKK